MPLQLIMTDYKTTKEPTIPAYYRVFIVLDRLYAAEISVTWLQIRVSHERVEGPSIAHVKPWTALPSLKTTTSAWPLTRTAYDSRFTGV